MAIPNNIDDCIKQLHEIISVEQKEKIRQMEEKDFVISSHFGLGLWIRNNWLYGYRSDLRTWFKDREIEHEYDMSAEISKQFYNSLKK